MDLMMAVINVMTTCLWMTSDADVIASNKFQTSYHAVPRKILGQELGISAGISARSKIECAVQCRRHSQCKSFAFDKRVSSSSCYLQLNTSSTSGTVSSGTSNTLVVYEQSAVYASCNITDIADSTAAVAIRLSPAGRFEATCTNDYYPQGVSAFCLPDGKWSPSDFRCLKRIWRYPETTTRDFPIPGTVVQSWSVCIEGIPTANTLFGLQICEVCDNNIAIHTSWRFHDNACGACLAINDKVSATWAGEDQVTEPPFPLVVGQPFAFRLTVNTTNTIYVYMNGMFFAQRTLRLPLMSFSTISATADVNVSRVEAWCNH